MVVLEGVGTIGGSLVIGGGAISPGGGCCGALGRDGSSAAFFSELALLLFGGRNCGFELSERVSDKLSACMISSLFVEVFSAGISSPSDSEK